MNDNTFNRYLTQLCLSLYTSAKRVEPLPRMVEHSRHVRVSLVTTFNDAPVWCPLQGMEGVQ